MPELIEVETYRRQAEALVGRTVDTVVAPDAWYLKGTTAAELTDALVGRTVRAPRRIGKLLVLDLSGDVRLGLRFGMTGRLVVDGAVAIDRLLYSPPDSAVPVPGAAASPPWAPGRSARHVPGWDRFGLHLVDPAGEMVMRDPRRLGGVSLDPDEGWLGVDAASVTGEQLGVALRGRRALKAALLDQSRVAGLGNLLVDEILWRAGLDPARPATSLGDDAMDGLSALIRGTVAQLDQRGGSHTGDLQEARARGGRCPRDGALLDRRSIGGRTTVSCPRHQRSS
ncbi:MAG: DNA-formamidopyrimidine glycosylase family protein [Acidimicrobiales bacterium]